MALNQHNTIPTIPKIKRSLYPLLYLLYGNPCALSPPTPSSCPVSLQIGREVLDAAGRAVRVGASTDEIDRVVSCYDTVWEEINGSRVAGEGGIHYLNEPSHGVLLFFFSSCCFAPLPLLLLFLLGVAWRCL